MIRVDRKFSSTNVLDVLTDLFILRGPPENIRSDNGPKFIAQKVRDWNAAVRAKTAYIEPVHPRRTDAVKLQRLLPQRTVEWRDLLQLEGGANPDRAMVHPRQHDQAAQRPTVSSALPTQESIVPMDQRPTMR